MTGGAHEVPLTGLANAGRVVRVGETVRRPVGTHTASVHAWLDHLARCGFTGAPRVHGNDGDGRAIVDYVPGVAGSAPYEPWVADDELLTSVATLLRELHDASAGFVEPAEAVWDRTLAAPPDLVASAAPGDRIVGHNDVSVENVIVRGGRAVAFIDFDFAAPTDRLWDVAIAARHWVPLWHPAEVDPARVNADQVARFGRFVVAYGVVEQPAVARIVELAQRFVAHALAAIEARAARGEAAYVRLLADGYAARNRRAQAWIADRADHLAAAARP